MFARLPGAVVSAGLGSLRASVGSAPVASDATGDAGGGEASDSVRSRCRALFLLTTRHWSSFRARSSSLSGLIVCSAGLRCCVSGVASSRARRSISSQRLSSSSSTARWCSSASLRPAAAMAAAIGAIGVCVAADSAGDGGVIRAVATGDGPPVYMTGDPHTEVVIVAVPSVAGDDFAATSATSVRGVVAAAAAVGGDVVAAAAFVAGFAAVIHGVVSAVAAGGDVALAATVALTAMLFSRAVDCVAVTVAAGGVVALAATDAVLSARIVSGVAAAVAAGGVVTLAAVAGVDVVGAIDRAAAAVAAGGVVILAATSPAAAAAALSGLAGDVRGPVCAAVPAVPSLDSMIRGIVRVAVAAAVVVAAAADAVATAIAAGVVAAVVDLLTERCSGGGARLRPITPAVWTTNTASGDVSGDEVAGTSLRGAGFARGSFGDVLRWESHAEHPGIASGELGFLAAGLAGFRGPPASLTGDGVSAAAVDAIAAAAAVAAALEGPVLVTVDGLMLVVGLADDVAAELLETTLVGLADVDVTAA